MGKFCEHMDQLIEKLNERDGLTGEKRKFITYYKIGGYSLIAQFNVLVQSWILNGVWHLGKGEEKIMK